MIAPPLAIGLIGCGRAAEHYYVAAFERARHARLVAVADPLPERRALIASAVGGCAAYPSAEALLAKTPVQALIVAAPPATHLPLAALAVRAGIPVLVEKPLAPSMAGVADFEALVAAARAVVMLGFTRRYWAPLRELRRIMSASGDADGATAQLVITSNVEAWAGITGISDPLEDLGPHQLDTLRWVFAREIVAVGARWHGPHALTMRVRLAGGVTAVCEASFADVSRESMVVRGRAGAYGMYVGSERLQPVDGAGRRVLDLSDAVRRRLRGRLASMHHSFDEQLAAFCRVVCDGVSPDPGLADGIAVVRAVEAARQSADRGGAEVALQG